MKTTHLFLMGGAESVRATQSILMTLNPDKDDVVIAWQTKNLAIPVFPDWVHVWKMVDAGSGHARFSRLVRILLLSLQTRFLLCFSPLLRSAKLIVYMQHPSYPTANYFFFRRPDVECRLLPDGMVNYTDKKTGPASGKMEFARSVIGFLTGLGHRRVLEGKSLTFHESGRYAKTYCFSSESFRTVSGELQVLCRPEPLDLTLDPRAILFLDQELGEICDQDLQDRFRNEVLKEIVASKPSVLIYKGHPRGKNRADVFREAGLNVIESPRSTPAEEIFEKYTPANVVSFFTTSFFTISAMAPKANFTAYLPASPGRQELEEYVDRISTQLDALDVKTRRK